MLSSIFWTVGAWLDYCYFELMFLLWAVRTLVEDRFSITDFVLGLIIIAILRAARAAAPYILVRQS